MSDRNDDTRKANSRLELGDSDFEQAQQFVGAVLGKEVVRELDRAKLPEMHQQEVEILVVDVQPVLPDVPILPVRVPMQSLVVRMNEEVAGIEARDPLEHERDSVLVARVRSEVDCVAENFMRSAATSRVDPQERVPEHRGGAVHEPFREDERQPFGAESGAPALVLRALDSG